MARIPGRKVVSDIAEQDARAMEAWRLRAVEGLSNKEIAKRIGVCRGDQVTKILRRARELIPPEYEERKDLYFEEALAQMDALTEKLAKRLDDSLQPTLNLRRIEDDLAKGIIKPFVVERYYKHGFVNLPLLKQDMADNSPELMAVANYLEPGRLDLAAVKEYRATVESKRKLLGLDRNKHRLELSAAEGAGGEVAKDAIDQIANLAKARLAKRQTIEVQPKAVSDGAG